MALAATLSPAAVASQTVEDSLPPAARGTEQFPVGERLLYDAKIGPIHQRYLAQAKRPSHARAVAG